MRVNETSTPRVTWTELFYDLIIAASMLFLYGSLAKHLSWGEFIWLSSIALIVFGIWLSTSLIYNRLPGDGTARRLLVIAQMVMIVFAVASMERSDKIDGDIGLVSLGAALLLLSFMWFQVARAHGSVGAAERIPAYASLVGGVFLVTSAILPDWINQAQVLVGGAIAFVPLFVFYLPRLVTQEHLDMHHLRERLGQLTLIMLGETFLEMAVIFTKGADPRLLGVMIVLAILVLIWWQYFTYVNTRPVSETPARIDFYLIGHAFLVVGLGSAALSLTEIALAVGEQLSLPILAAILGLSLATAYAGMSLIVIATPSPAPVLIPLALATLCFLVLSILLSTVFELDEMVTGLLMTCVVLVTLVATAIGGRGSAVRAQAA